VLKPEDFDAKISKFSREGAVLPQVPHARGVQSMLSMAQDAPWVK